MSSIKGGGLVFTWNISRENKKKEVVEAYNFQITARQLTKQPLTKTPGRRQVHQSVKTMVIVSYKLYNSCTALRTVNLTQIQKFKKVIKGFSREFLLSIIKRQG